MISPIKVFDIKFVFDKAVVKAVVSTDDLNRAIDTILEEFKVFPEITFKHSFATERRMGKILKIHSVTVVCPECQKPNYIPDLSAVDRDGAGLVSLFCEKCHGKYFLVVNHE